MSVALPIERRRSGAGVPSGGLAMGASMLWLSLIVLLPLAAVVARSLDGGLDAFWDAVTSRQAVSALRFTLLVSLATAAINAVVGTLIAWVLVRDELPRASASSTRSSTCRSRCRRSSPASRCSRSTGRTARSASTSRSRKLAVLLALLFVTLPFVIRSVQPVLIELDREMEEAAASLGRAPGRDLPRVILPSLIPAILSGAALAFARAVGEFGSVVLISGNIPFDTQVASVFVYKQIESDNPGGAAAVSVVLLLLSLLVLVAIRCARGVGEPA